MLILGSYTLIVAPMCWNLARRSGPPCQISPHRCNVSPLRGKTLKITLWVTCIICIIASSNLSLLILGVTQQWVYETIQNVLRKRLMQTWFDFDQDIIDAVTNQQRDYLRLCVRVGGHFEHMFWHECSFILINRTFQESFNIIWCM